MIKRLDIIQWEMNDFVHKFLDYTIGNIFGKDITCREPVHRCDNYQPGILTEFGRVGIKVCVRARAYVYTHTHTQKYNLLFLGKYFFIIFSTSPVVF